MAESEREMLREDEEAKLGERRPFESSRQATYEDTVGKRCTSAKLSTTSGTSCRSLDCAEAMLASLESPARSDDRRQL